MTINTVLDSLGLRINGRTLALGAARLGFLLIALVFFQIGANAQTPAEQQCFDLVQGKVAYDQQGNKSWNPDNIRALCTGTVSPQTTVDCFTGQIAAGVTWSPAIQACRANPTGTQTPEQECRNLIQGKVAYDKEGNKNWDEANMADVCRGTTNPQATVDCFTARIAIGAFWYDARDTCKAKPASAPSAPTTPEPAREFPDTFREAAGRRAVVPGKPVNQLTWLGMHNAISSYAYGYISQNSQRYDVTTQLNGGARMLEIDIVWDTPDDKQAAGVYVCHCGEAPHSYSKSEMKRARDKPMKSLLPLPAWSSGATYTRFSTILNQIDKWLVANPNEIVFIMLENHKVFQDKFDTEVLRAALKTGTYIKPRDKEWATKAQLITAKQRLIILAHDGGEDLSLSRYANEKAVTRWGGDLQPEIYGAKNTYDGGKGAGDSNAIIAVGSFATGATDAITARYFNEYDHFNRRRAEWIAKGYSRMPTFIQVNQIQIGDALKFVNELNGPENQVVGTVPKDQFGNWIVNASADIGQAFYDLPGATKEGLTNVGDAIVNLFGKPVDTSSTPVTKPISYTVKVKTSDIGGAGTDSEIHLRIHGLGYSKTNNIHLNPLISENAFERGETNTVVFTAQDVGEVSYITVQSNLGGGFDNGWHPEYIEITVGGRTSRIKIDGWIDKDRPRASVFYR